MRIPENMSTQLLVTKKPMISTQNVSLAIELADFCVPFIWLGPVVQLSMVRMIASQKQQLSWLEQVASSGWWWPCCSNYAEMLAPLPHRLLSLKHPVVMPTGLNIVDLHSAVPPLVPWKMIFTAEKVELDTIVGGTAAPIMLRCWHRYHIGSCL